MSYYLGRMLDRVSAMLPLRVKPGISSKIQLAHVSRILDTMQDRQYALFTIVYFFLTSFGFEYPARLILILREVIL